MAKHIIKRDGRIEDFNLDKIKAAIKKAFNACNAEYNEKIDNYLALSFKQDSYKVEDVQDYIEKALLVYAPLEVLKAFILYRDEHKQSRFIKERIDYMDKYANSTENAASSSETDANANITSKNVATLESEVYKANNRVIQRQRMKDKLNALYPDSNLGKQYIEDLNHHIIYTHDEASTPVLKQYCMAVSLYPLMLEGVGNIDGVTPGPPNDLQSFSGQITNLIFLLSSQCKGAVAVSEYFIALNYYVIAEFGNKWYDILDKTCTTNFCLQQRTVRQTILKAFKQFVWGINQPAGNRSYQSPLRHLVIS